uniref:Endonuclease/exonuclease/phosphatase domain-containing protein n=1 Tax=Hucho hucho TaxID=62062 RepID=A0A4W5PN64_9TELE
AVYIPPQADTSTALKEIHWTLCKLETTYPEAAFIVAGDFNKANLKTRLPKCYQHIECATRAHKILDHCYFNVCDAYKAILRPPFGKSDHDSILLLPAYRQKLKQETPVLRSVQRWSDQSDSTLQDCFEHVDWDMFRIASDNNIVYADSMYNMFPWLGPWINNLTCLKKSMADTKMEVTELVRDLKETLNPQMCRGFVDSFLVQKQILEAPHHLVVVNILYPAWKPRPWKSILRNLWLLEASVRLHQLPARG